MSDRYASHGGQFHVQAKKKSKTKKNGSRTKKRPPIAGDVAAHTEYWKGELGGTPDWPALIGQLEPGEVVNGIEVTERALAMAKERVRGVNMRQIGDQYGLSRERVRKIASRIEAVVEAKLAVRGGRQRKKKTTKTKTKKTKKK